ncbi:MAG: beta-N-acetylhexosaminidase [Abditibacteriales bacterium]|nr:beta-N-acetylhexosaminidase [Abditibacteriales bacterium]MDW8365965.1 glycoside hydrolase family 20 zincin-like fold domain-containing protein [Abditibacteriales bacterium]
MKRRDITLHVARWNVGTLYVIAFYVLASPLLAEDEFQPTSISAQNWTATTTADNGVRVAYRGVPIVSGTRFMLRDLAGRHVLFASANSAPAVQAHADELRLSFESKGQLANGSEWQCRVTQRVTLLDGERVRVASHIVYTGSTPLRLGNSGLWLSANLLKGCVWRARTPRGVRHGTLPLQPDLRRISTDDFRAAVKRAYVRSRLGDFIFTVGGNCGSLNFSDARRGNVEDPNYSAVFWLGINNVRLSPGASKWWEVVIELKENAGQLVRPISEVNEAYQRANLPTFQRANISLLDVPDATTPVEEPIVIVPRPQVYEAGEADFPLRPDTRILIADSSPPEEQRIAHYLAKELRRLGEGGSRRLNLSVSAWRGESLPENVIFVGGYGRVARAGGGSVRLVADETPPRADTNRADSAPSGSYVLRADDKRVVVSGVDARGTFYGVQTLLQMVKTRADGQRVIQGAQIRDYPDFPFRGVHLHADKDTLPWVTQLIEKVFSRLKITHIVLECQYARWDSHPELAPAWAMSKDDMRQLKEVAAAHFIQIIPLIQSLGHAEWMFARGQNLDLAEDKHVPYACCPSEPKVYNLLFDVYKEAIEVFQPEYLHVGLDEVGSRGRFGECPRCFGTPIPDLFLNHVLRLYNFLKDNNVKMMMWGDMLLLRGEARDATHGGPPMHTAAVRLALPKDIVICDWHYAPAYDYPSVRLFRSLGFPVIGATWHNPYNIYAFSRAAQRAGAMGMLQTTWAGYHGNRNVLRREPQQVTAYVLAAERAWNARGSYTLPYAPRLWLREALMARPAPPPTTHKGFVLDLAPLCNIELTDNGQAGGWLKMGAGNDLRRVPTGRQRLHGTLFQIPAAEGSWGGRGILLRGAYTTGAAFPESVILPIRRPARALRFLHTCAWQVSPGTKVGVYEIHFADGTKEEVELVYGDNIAAWDDPAAAYHPASLWHGHTLRGNAVSLQTTLWDSGDGAKEIDRIVFRTTHFEASPLLLAVTGVEE